MATNNTETVTFISLQGAGAIQQAMALPALQQLGTTGGARSSARSTGGTRGGSSEQHAANARGNRGGGRRKKAEGTGGAS